MAEQQLVNESLISTAKRKVEQSLYSTQVFSQNLWQASCQLEDFPSEEFPPRNMKTVADLEERFPYIGRVFGLSSSTPLATTGSRIEWSREFKMELDGVKLTGGLEIVYSTLEDMRNEVPVDSGMEFSFKIEKGKDGWDLDLIRKSHALLDYIIRNSDMAQRWLNVGPVDPPVCACESTMVQLSYNAECLARCRPSSIGDMDCAQVFGTWTVDRVEEGCDIRIYGGSSSSKFAFLGLIAIVPFGLLVGFGVFFCCQKCPATKARKKSDGRGR